MPASAFAVVGSHERYADSLLVMQLMFGQWSEACVPTSFWHDCVVFTVLPPIPPWSCDGMSVSTNDLQSCFSFGSDESRLKSMLKL